VPLFSPKTLSCCVLICSKRPGFSLVFTSIST
jgi:hypothetical protein